MLKIFPILILMVMLGGCADSVGNAVVNNPASNLVKATTKGVYGLGKEIVTVTIETTKEAISFNNGYLLVFAAMEANTNFSSLLIDKTKEKIDAYEVTQITPLTPGRFVYVMPVKITSSDGKYRYDEEITRMIRNYMTIGKYAIPVDNIASAEYVTVININESIEKRHGTNTSTVAFSIMNKMDYPMFAATVRVKSSSDRNFWYHSERDARPVKQLTMQGLSYIMAESLPDANGDKETLAKTTKEYVGKAQSMFNGKES